MNLPSNWVGRILGQGSVLAIMLGLLLISCDIYTPDTDQPQIQLSYPPDSAVIGDSVLMQVNAEDNKVVARVEYYQNGRLDSAGIQTEPPFDYMWNAREDSMPPGKKVQLFAKAFDAQNNEMISNFIKVMYQWKTLVNDANDDSVRNLDQVMVRTTSSNIDFRISSYKRWKDLRHKADGLRCAIFMDTDQDSGTGYNPDQQFFGPDWSFLEEPTKSYEVNDIGPEYMLILGIEGNQLYNWNTSAGEWQPTGELEFTAVESDTNVFEVGLTRETIGNPRGIDLAVANITIELDYEEEEVDTIPHWDWAPDESHSSFKVLEDYIVGNEVQ